MVQPSASPDRRGVDRRAVTLAETVVAIVLLAWAILLVSRLFQEARREQTRTSFMRRSAAWAEALTDQIRQWATDRGNFFSDWSTYDGADLSDANYPGLRARVDVKKDQPLLYSACQESESLYPGAQRKLRQSCVTVRVRCGPNPDQPNQYVELVTIVGAPVRGTPSLSVARVGGAGDPVPFNGVVDFEARAVDGDGRPMTDLFYYWVFEPGSGEGSLKGVSRDGRTCEIQNGYWNDGVWASGGGTVRVRLVARYHGRWVSASGPSVLNQ